VCRTRGLQGSGAFVGPLAAVDHGRYVELGADLQHAVDLARELRRHQERGGVGERHLQRFERAVVRRPLATQRRRRVERLALGVVPRVRKHLFDVRQAAHQRTGERPETAAAAEVHALRHRRRDDALAHLAAAAEVDQRRLAGEQPVGRRAHCRGETRLAPLLDAGVVGQLVGDRDPRGRSGTVFGPADRRSAAAEAAARPAARVAFLLLSHRRHRVDQAGKQGEALAVDDPGVRRNVHRGADRRDQPVGDQHRGAVDRRAGTRDDADVLDRVVGRAGGLLGQGRRGQECADQRRCAEKDDLFQSF
jgi:hypothetical protein